MGALTPTATSEPRPLRADARRNRERILAAAREAFAEAGRDVQMPEVARAAGVGVGTLYRHFPAKEDLVLALVRDKVQAAIDIAREALTRDDPWEAIEWLVHQNAAKMAHSRGLRDAMSVIDFGDENPWNSERGAPPRRRGARPRARAPARSAADLTVDDWQALMCGLSAAIASGADPRARPTSSWTPYAAATSAFASRTVSRSKPAADKQRVINARRVMRKVVSSLRTAAAERARRLAATRPSWL